MEQDMKVFTIGHSTRSFEEFLKVLQHYDIQLLVDVRKLPGSNKFPWFNKENLEKQLPANVIEYMHYPELGGFRKGGYETFAQTYEFSEAVKNLLKIIDGKKSTIMCAEVLPWRCHRRYIAEKLSQLGNEVIHIFNEKKTIEHKEMKDKMHLKIFCDKS